MVGLNQKEGRYRVLLIGIGDNTEEEKSSFCRNLSKNYSIPSPLLKKIADSSPIIIKKNIPFKKAETLAKRLRSFGARVSVEERRDLPPLSLEFQELAPHQLELESSYLRKTPRAAWSVVGRVKNITDQNLADAWVLVQLFDDPDEFIAFEETPLSINPLPPGEASPFKVIFEGNLSVKRISIAFKNASGQPIAAVDKTRKKEWTEVPIGEGGFIPRPRISAEMETKAQAASLPEPVLSAVSLAPEPLEKALESSFSALEEDGSPDAEESEGMVSQEASQETDSFAPEEMEGEREEEGTLSSVERPSDEREVDETEPVSASAPENAIQLPEGVTEIPDPSFSWIESFKKAVETYYEKPHDSFSIWFEECRRGGELKGSFHALSTILVHSRFEQGHPSVKALENTKKVFGLIAQPNLPVGEVPALEGTSFASGEVWTDLFQRALPKIQQIGNRILDRNKWSAPDLERLVQVIPHMGPQNSRNAIKWISELLPDVMEVDLSGTSITVGKELYRVASRLGVVDPRSDHYEGPHSTGNTKIQSFAKVGFPENPGRVEEPMASMGMGEEQGGHCFPTRPWCEGCLFEAFCPKLYVDFDPSENGMK